MEVLSSSASVFAVVSFAIQLAESAKKLYEFWGSVKDAPDTIQSMTTDLDLLSSVLSRIALEAQSSRRDHTVIAVLTSCSVKLHAITVQIDRLEPGFASKNASVRKWSAIKTALKKGKLETMLSNVEATKTTLILAQQSFYGQLSRHHHESHQQAITGRSDQTLDHIGLKSISTVSTTSSIGQLSIQDNLVEMRAEISRIVNDTKLNHVYRFGLQKALEKAIQDTVKETSDSRSGQEPRVTDEHMLPTGSHSASVSHRPAFAPCELQSESMIIRHSFSVLESLFGVIYIEVRITSRDIQLASDSPTSPQTTQYETSRTLVFRPADWLMKLGLSYSLHVGICENSVRGWTHTLAINHPVPDDALIFEFVRQGNLPATRSLMSRGLASVRDVDSYGRTALWFAARGRHLDMCKYLIGAGANKSASMHKGVEGWNMGYERTPLLAIAKGPRQDLRNTTDLLRLFADCIDLTDENSDVWPLFTALSPIMKTDGEPFVLEWLLRSFGSDIKPRFHRHEFALILDVWMRSAEQGVSELLAYIGGCGINATLRPDGYSILHHTLGRFSNPLLYLRNGANPHLVGLELSYSPYWESPTSLAMFHSAMFDIWRTALMTMNIDFKEFVQLEIYQQRSPLLQAGWNPDSLLSLFHYRGLTPSGGSVEDSLGKETGPTLTGIEYMICSDCSGDPGMIWVEPRWLQRLERIRLRLDLGVLSAPSNDDAEFSASTVSKTHDTKFNSINDVIPLTKLDPEGSNGGLTHSDDSHLQETFQDQTARTRIDVLELHFRNDDILCMRCWQNYKSLGYNPASKFKPRSGSKSAKKRHVATYCDAPTDNELMDKEWTDNDFTDDDLQNDYASDDGSLTDREYSPFLIHY